MRIAINFNPLPGTGIARYSRRLLETLGEPRINRGRCEVIGFSFARRDPRPEWLPDAIAYRATALPGRVQHLLHTHLFRGMETLFGLENVDAVHTLDLHPIRARQPQIRTVYDVAWRQLGSAYTSVVSADWIKEAEAAIRQASHLCAISRTTADELVTGGIKAANITVTPLGVDQKRFEGAQTGFAELQAKYALPERFLLYVGAINIRKNLPIVVSALSQMRNAPPLMLAGPPPMEGLAHWGLTGIKARHLGYVSDADLAGLYRAAVALIFPSLQEGFGLPLVEAMAMGTPILASQIPVFAELGSGVVRFFDPADASSLRQAIEEIDGEETLREQMRQAGLTRAAQFTWEKCAEATLEAYSKVVGLRTSTP